MIPRPRRHLPSSMHNRSYGNGEGVNPGLSTDGIVVAVRKDLHDLEGRRVAAMVVEYVEDVSVNCMSMLLCDLRSASRYSPEEEFFHLSIGCVLLPYHGLLVGVAQDLPPVRCPRRDLEESIFGADSTDSCTDGHADLSLLDVEVLRVFGMKMEEGVEDPARCEREADFEGGKARSRRRRLEEVDGGLR
jgi:hypothetical protein